MTGADWRALALDAERVRDSLATLKWWASGAVAGAGSPSQEEQASKALRVIVSAESTANVVAVELGRIRDGAQSPLPEGDGE